MISSAPDWRTDYWEEFDEDGNERDPVAAMIDWLGDQSPLVWHKFAESYMNWDCAIPIGNWIVDQSNCDAATATLILLNANPTYFLGAAARNDKFENNESWIIIDKIIQNYSRGFYRKSSIEQAITENGEYHVLNKTLDDIKQNVETLPFEIPTELLKDYKGSIAEFPEGMSPYVNRDMWNLIYALGTDTPNIEFDEWFKAKEEAEKTKSRFSNWSSDWTNKLIWPGLGYFSVGTMCIAVIMRFLHFGTLDWALFAISVVLTLPIVIHRKLTGAWF